MDDRTMAEMVKMLDALPSEDRRALIAQAVVFQIRDEGSQTFVISDGKNYFCGIAGPGAAAEFLQIFQGIGIALGKAYDLGVQRGKRKSTGSGEDSDRDELQ